jgi:4-amino-4-deoxy-L-arabinose transferase-like glycosyltransferase
VRDKIISLLPILLIATIGLIYRLIGISQNLSFWNDEINVGMIARGILWYGEPVTPIGAGWGMYQIALNYLTALSFTVFEISEWAGRFPSVLAGTALVISGYYIASRLLNRQSAVIVSLLLAFSQIQLAWSTQLRPYIWMELFVIWIIYYLYRYLQDVKHLIDRHLITASVLSGVSILFHGTGLLNLVIISAVFLYQIVRQKKYIYLTIIPVVALLAIAIIYYSFGGGWDFVITTLTRFHWSTTHYRVFLTHHYLWLVAGSLFGFLALYRSNKKLAFLLAGSVAFIFFMAIFKIHPRYVRYSITAFPLMYILFASGVVFLVNKVTHSGVLRWLAILTIFVSLSFTGKIVLTPQYYYTLNADMRENPIVDYKYAYSKIQDLIRDREDTIILEAWCERPSWFLPDSKFATFSRYPGPDINPYYGEQVLKTLSDLEDIMAVHASGVVVVEDWESMTPPEINKYVRQNLKFEFAVQDLPHNDGDHWGVSVYSWGI